MSARYLLPCPKCDAKNPVVFKQAGWTIQCLDCEKDVEVPKLRDMKLLPVDDDSGAQEQKRRKTYGSSPKKRMLFGTGLLLAILGFGIWGGTYQYTQQMITDIDNEKEVEANSETIDKMSVVELWKSWDTLGAVELGAWREDQAVTDNKKATLFRQIAYVPLGLGILGLCSLLGSFFVRS